METIKPCPFCGSQPTLEPKGSGKIRAIVCSEKPCADSGLFVACRDSDIETAIAAWNTRASQDRREVPAHLAQRVEAFIADYAQPFDDSHGYKRTAIELHELRTFCAELIAAAVRNGELTEMIFHNSTKKLLSNARQEVEAARAEGYERGRREALPEKIPQEWLVAIRNSPLTKFDDVDEMHERIGWFCCAWAAITESARASQAQEGKL